MECFVNLKDLLNFEDFWLEYNIKFFLLNNKQNLNIVVNIQNTKWKNRINTQTSHNHQTQNEIKYKKINQHAL